jgi:Uma2 family endonuclease
MTALDEPIGAMAPLIGLTWDEYLALPFETRNSDLIDGRVVVNSPNAQHERIIGNLHIAFVLWQRQFGYHGQLTTQQPVKISHRRGYQPDASWFPAEQSSEPDQRAAFSGLPAIVVEVLSPSTRRLDLVRKRADYDRLLIPEFWLIDQATDSVLRCFRPAEGQMYDDEILESADRLASPILPGFDLKVTSLFVAPGG